MSDAILRRRPNAEDPLGPRLRGLFRDLPLAGPLPPECAQGTNRVLRGAAGQVTEGTRLVFHICVAKDDRVTDVRFQAYGCPHTLATAAWLAAQLPGRSLETLLPSAPSDWALHLGIPIEKLGRLLIIEDALRAISSAEGDV